MGKLKEKYLADGINEYAKRLKRFCRFETVELPDMRIPENASELECKKVIDTEGEAILKKIGRDSYVISLCIEGRALSSEKLAQKLSEVMLGGKSTVTFVIGGSLGLSDEVKKRSDFLLSFSSFTFPHQLMRLILSEQIYRAFKINANEEYHK